MSDHPTSAFLLCLSICLLCLPIAGWNSTSIQSSKELIAALGAAKTADERTQLLAEYKALATPEFLESLIAEADRLRRANENDAAMSSFLAAVEAARSLQKPHWEAYAINSVGEMYRIKGEYGPAMDQLEKALALSRQNADKDQIAESLTNMGKVFYMQGNLQESEKRLRESVATSRSEGNKDQTAGALSILGLALGDQGEIQEAIDTLKEAVNLYEQMGNTLSLPSPLSNMARLLALRGDYDASMESLQKALETTQSTGRKDYIPPLLMNMGNIYSDRGNFRLALAFTEQALALYKDANYQFGVGDSLNNLGELYQVQGNLELAREFYEKAQAQYQAVGAQARVAVTLANIGSVYGLQKQNTLARKFFNQSLKIRREIGDKEGVASVLSMLAYTDGEEGNYDAALQSFQESLKISEEISDVEPLSQTNILLAKTYRKMGNDSKAVEAALNALAYAEKIPEDELIWQSQAIAGNAFMAQGNFESSQEYLEKSIQTIENQRGSVVGGEQQMQEFFEMRTAPYDSLVKLRMLQNQPEQALAVVERARGRVLLDVLQSGKTLVMKSMTTEEQQKEKKLNDQLVELNKRILFENQASATPDLARIKSLKSQLDHVRLESEAFQTSLFAAHPELRIQRGEIPDFRIADAAGMYADHSTALLEFMVDEEKTFLFVISGVDPPALKVYTIPIKRRALADTVARFKEQLASRDPLFRKSAQAAFKMLLAPAWQQLKNKTNLVIVPDAELWHLPFQALLSGPDRYLIDDAAISYAPSLSVLREMKQLHETIHGTDTLLAFGNPAFGKASAQPGAIRANWNPLPESEKEVKAISALYASDSKVYLGAEAREDRLKTGTDAFRILHMATHGTFDDASPMYSYLVLSQLNANSSEDGLLEAWEILKMDLKFNLVILSACETARGHYGTGEGMIGLTWAFFVAGCPTTVVSQWKVESASTARLMVEFHKNLRISGAKPGEALRQAELSLRHSEDFSHPFYWAPFVLVGAGS